MCRNGTIIPLSREAGQKRRGALRSTRVLRLDLVPDLAPLRGRGGYAKHPRANA